MRNADGEIQAVSTDLRSLLQNTDAQVEPLSASVTTTLDEARTLMSNADGEIQGISTDLRTLLQDTDAQVEPLSASAMAALDEARETLARLDEFVGDRYALFHQVDTLLEEIAGAARAVRTLAAYLERHPEALVSGKGN